MTHVMTVQGPIDAGRLGRTLPHEHVMVDFIGADQTGPERWAPDTVVARMLPFLQAARHQGVQAFVDCTPAYLGRDVRVLRTLSELTGLHILTNAGLYKEPYLPPYTFVEDEDALAARWVAEWRDGIDGTDIRPGFIKIAVNPGPLAPMQRKVVRAAARASSVTGLAIACHCGHGPAAMECLAVLAEERVPADRYIFVHADGEEDRSWHLAAARAGAWIEVDSIGWRPVEWHVELVTWLLGEGLAGRLLLSHDAGWYHVGEPEGGEVKPYTVLLGELGPALRRAGVSAEVWDQLTVDNPAKAFAQGG